MEWLKMDLRTSIKRWKIVRLFVIFVSFSDILSKHFLSAYFIVTWGGYTKMIPLLFILIITGVSILISYSLSSEVTWLDYYKGGMVGLFISGVLLSFWNKRRRDKEARKNKR